MSDATVEGTRMSFFDHLSELAQRLKRALFAFIIAFVAVSSVPNPFHPFGGPTSLFGYNFLVITLVNDAENYYLGTFKPLCPWSNISDYRFSQCLSGVGFRFISALHVLPDIRIHSSRSVPTGEKGSKEISRTFRGRCLR